MGARKLPIDCWKKGDKPKVFVCVLERERERERNCLEKSPKLPKIVFLFFFLFEIWGVRGYLY